MPRRTSSSIAALVLAAGASVRMGTPKQKLRARPGVGPSFLRHAALGPLEAGCRPVVVVLGAHAEALRGELDGLDVEIIDHVGWSEGIASSIRSGLRGLEATAPEAEAVLVVLTDQPEVDADAIGRLCRAFSDSRDHPVAAAFEGRLGAPAIFPRRLFPALAALRGDRGAAALLGAEDTIGVPLPGAARDVDTPDDYRRLTGREPEATA